MIKLHESFKEDEKPEWLTMDERDFRIQQVKNDSTRRIKITTKEQTKNVCDFMAWLAVNKDVNQNG